MSPSLVRCRFVRLVAIAAVLVAACAPAGATPAGGAAPCPVASSPGTLHPPPVLTIRVAIPAAIFEPLYPRAAKDAGLYAEDGLDVEFVEVLRYDHAVGRDQRRVPGRSGGAQSVLTAASQGSDAVMVAAPHTALPFIFAAQDVFASLGESLRPAVGGAPGAASWRT